MGMQELHNMVTANLALNIAETALLVTLVVFKIVDMIRR